MATYREVMDHAELIAEVKAATDSVAEWALACARRRSALDAALAAQIAAQGKLVELEGRLLAVFPMEEQPRPNLAQAFKASLERASTADLELHAGSNLMPPCSCYCPGRHHEETCAISAWMESTS